MKFRNGFLATATVFAVACGTVVPATADDTAPVVPAAEENPVETGASSELFSNSSTADILAGSSKTDPATDGEKAETTPGTSSTADLDPTKIAGWIGIFTAIIGALSATFSFVSKVM